MPAVGFGLCSGGGVVFAFENLNSTNDAECLEFFELLYDINGFWVSVSEKILRVSPRNTVVVNNMEVGCHQIWEGDIYAQVMVVGESTCKLCCHLKVEYKQVAYTYRMYL